MQDGICQERGHFFAEGPLVGSHFIEHGSKSPDVSARIRVLAAQLLGRHIRKRAEDGLRFGQRQ